MLAFSLLLGFGVSMMIEVPLLGLEKILLGGRLRKADEPSKQ